MFDIGPGEFLVLALVALFVFGPERLPGMARQAGRWIRDLRRVVADARRDLAEHTGLDPEDLAALRDLDPRSHVRRHVLDGLSLDDDEPARRHRANGSSRSGGGGSAGERQAPAVDPDAT